ncbi:MAG: tRNA (cytidine(34)-2'-O)-methyltransferase [Planctomycetota bacterium]
MSDLHIVLVHPEIPWNTGNTARSCLAFAAHLHLIEPLGFSLDAREVRRAGLDYWEHVALTLHPDWETFEARLGELGEPWFLTREASLPLHDAPLRPPAVFVLGRESVGLPRALRQRYRDRLVGIPQREGVVRSLNLSTAAALAAYEFRTRFPLQSRG